MPDIIDYIIPSNYGFSLRTESNNSSTVTITKPDGSSLVWNSGTFITCALLANGLGFTAWAYSGGKKIAYDLTTKLTAFGCTYVVKQIMADEGDAGGGGGGGNEDGGGGDGGGGNGGGDIKLPDIDPPKTPGGYWLPASVAPDPVDTAEISLVGIPDMIA